MDALLPLLGMHPTSSLDSLATCTRTYIKPNTPKDLQNKTKDLKKKIIRI